MIFDTSTINIFFSFHFLGSKQRLSTYIVHKTQISTFYMFKKILLTTVLCISFIGCSKQSDYQMAIASAQSREVIISYPDGYWRDIQSLSIKHVENGDNPVEYCPLSTDSDNKDCKQLKLTIPNPNQKELIWSDVYFSCIIKTQPNRTSWASIQ